MAYKFLKAADIKDQTVLLRVDFNEGLDERGRLGDDYKIQAVLPTVRFLREHGAKIIIMSHAGRPEGQWQDKYTLKPMAARLAELLDLKFVETEHEVLSYPLAHVVFVRGNLHQAKVQTAIKKIPAHNIIVLENLRFYPEEERNDSGFAKALASLGTVFVNDGFAVSHREAASTVAVTEYLPSFVGKLLEKEIRSLDYLLQKAKAPFVLIMGGIKISDKAKTLERLGKKADKILVGGGLANVFMAAEGLEIGESVIERESQQLAWMILKNFKDKIVLPKDVAVFDTALPQETAIIRNRYDVTKTEKICDIGPKAILDYAQIIKTAKTICWNGPLGYFEKKPFRAGTLSLARVVGGVSKGKAFGVVGGGETVAAVRQAAQEEYIDHVSTGGGAMLVYLSGAKMPALEALKKNKKEND
jgi:phosphoglycerate kinase